MVETQGNALVIRTSIMERTLDFSDVTNYDFSMVGPDMILKLFQGDTVTKIRIETGKVVANKIKSLTEQSLEQVTVKRKASTKMTQEQVMEIRKNWDQTVKACGTKNAAAERLSKIYSCSAKNIYAIIYKYSWAHV